ncbi:MULTISPECIES: type 1 glutamine amidotransferase domain-containing protein [unclassified Streptomyces]|uniref:type 1 glutamine amidotransferase domain-containing protein n=1 Tax=unclassified Streptomyces TaxID=2593676 RepID=UPI00081F1C34|nr:MULTISPECIES: type 1 glutamine amidotransferase domain-containing protein [unclassified Streptomyces]MYR25612.1 DJ-1/PfpI/YhbO family deglycase/protease [Streptomyces sp. SID4945]SCE84990.1 protease I [Streptomyces sp. LcepLS]
MAENTPDLSGHKVLAIVTNYGVEQDELVVLVDRLRDAGAEVTIAAAKEEPVQTLVGDKDPGKTVRPSAKLADVDPGQYELLLVPGGTLNADSLRLDDDALRIARDFTSGGRPVAAICHGPWLLVETGAVKGKTLTSYPSLRTDITNAGAAEWVDKEAVRCDAEGFTLITSRNPGDLDAFLREIDAVLAAA